jgi:hypothetical protein
MTTELTQGAPAGQRSLDPALLQVIRSSVGRLIRVQDAFTRQLQSDIITMIPDLPGDGWAFCERMVQAVLWAATTGQPPAEIIGGLRWVGAANQVEGFPEAQYVSVAHALVRTVHVLSESDWSTSTGSAWVSFFLWMRPHLLAGAQQAAAQQAAAAAQQAAAQEAARQQAAYWAQSAATGDAPPADGDVDLESAAGLLDDEEEDEDDDDPGYGQIMLNMTLSQRRERPRRPA